MARLYNSGQGEDASTSYLKYPERVVGICEGTDNAQTIRSYELYNRVKNEWGKDLKDTVQSDRRSIRVKI